MTDTDDQTPIESPLEPPEPPADESPFEIQPLDIQERSRHQAGSDRDGD